MKSLSNVLPALLLALALIAGNQVTPGRALLAAPPPHPDEEEEEEEEEWEEDEEGEGDAAAAAKARKKTGQEPAEDPASSVTPKQLTLDRLIEINAREIFGGKVKIRGEEFEVSFTGDGEVKAGFEGKGIIDSKSPEMKGAQRKVIRLKDKKDGEEEQLIPGLCAIGIGEGLWVSRFPVAGKTWVEMGFRVPNLLGVQSIMKLRINSNKGGGYETSFFQTVSALSGGKPKSTRTTPIKEYQGQPFDWFPRKGQSVRVEFGIRDGRALVRMDGKDMVALPKVADRGGKVSFVYQKLLFTLDNLKVTGKLDRAWCEKRIEELRAEGKLKEKAPPAPPEGEVSGG